MLKEYDNAVQFGTSSSVNALREHIRIHVQNTKYQQKALLEQ